MKINTSELGESVVVKLNFTSDEGVKSKDMKKGQWVIIYGEIPAKMIAKNTFLVFKDADIESVRKLEETLNKLESRTPLEKFIHVNRGEDYEKLMKNEPRYIFNNGKMKKNNFWER